MNYTRKEVMQYVEMENVKFIRLAFCDIFGNLKNIAIIPTELERAFEYGIGIDASAIAGFGGEVRSDLFLHPDPATLSSLPWRSENGRVVRMYCTITYPDGTPFQSDTRSVLINAIKASTEAGVSFNFGSEMEFYLFKTDEDGKYTKIPYDDAGYMDVAPDDKGENVRREICLTLSQMNIYPEASHHEEGPGQNEIDFRYSDPLTAADNALTFKSVVKTIVNRHGLYADFTPKPLNDKPGSGLHINISVKSDKGENVMDKAIAGIMDKISEITLFMNTTEGSYERLGNHKAPKYISWSKENRSQLIRIPASMGFLPRFELRSPDPCANPYLAFALLIYAGLYGIENNLALPESTDLNLYDAPSEITNNIAKLPQTLDEAREIAAKSEFIDKYIPESIKRSYCKR